MQLLSVVVVFVTGFVFGILAVRSPKRDWEFITGWPALALFVLSTALARAEYAPQIETTPMRFDCEWITNEAGLPERECTMIPGNLEVVYPGGRLGGLKDMIGSIITSVVIDAPLEVLGIFLGMSLARRRLALATLKDIVEPMGSQRRGPS